MKRAVLAAWLASVAWPGLAADIQVCGQVVTIDGDIAVGDFETFRAKTASLEKAAVVLKSAGGLIFEALEIGERIKEKGYSTYVEENCTSSCGFIWLAGSPRTKLATANVGFHRPYSSETWTAPSWVVDTVEAYMQALGLNNATIEFTLSATEPTDVIYLTENDATRLGLAVAIVPSPVTASLHLPCASEGTEETEGGGDNCHRVGAAGLSRKVIMNATTSRSSWLDSNAFAMCKFFGTAGSVSK
jgi:hypothetical protein